VQGVDALRDVKVGDVIVFDVPTQPIPLVHRVVAINNSDGEIYFTTKGDNNPYVLQVEGYIKPAQIRGRVVFVIPKIGYLSLLWQGR
jgi:signal peptidase I